MNMKCLLKKTSLLTIVILSLLCSCNTEKAKQKKFTLEDATRVSHITSGVISSEDTIAVKFNQPVISMEKTGINLTQPLFNFTPDIKGVCRWDTTDELVFIPDSPLSLKTDYKGTVKISKLLESAKDMEFSFHVSGRELLSVEGDFSKAPDTDENQVIFQGSLLFNEKIDLDSVKKATRISLDKKNLTTTWSIREDFKLFTFVTEIVKRDMSTHTITVDIDASDLDVSSDFSKTYSLTPAKKLEIVRVQEVSGRSGNTVALNFSDNLDDNQNIDGFIVTTPHMPLKTIKKNKIITLKGTFKHGQEYSITVRKGIKSKWGTQLAEDKTFSVSFSDMNPIVQFTSDGLFMPSGNNRKLRFTTVNLKKVHAEITRIFESNLGQFLQNSDIDSEATRNNQFYNENRVGVVVAEQDLVIGDTKNETVVSEIDLNSLMKPTDKGMFIVKLSFEKDDMMFEGLNDGNRYSDYYNDPRSWGYMYRHGQIFKPVIISNIGLAMKQAGSFFQVFVTDLSTANPASGVPVTLRTYQNQIIQTTVSDRNGFAEFTDIKEQVYYIEAEKNHEKSFLLPDRMAWNTSSFDVEGVNVSDARLKAFIFSERGVYRPGDPVHISVILRNETNTFPDNHPVTMKITNSKNQEVFKETSKSGLDGLYTFQLKTQLEDPTGNWQIEVEAAGSKFFQPLRIEEVVPFKLKTQILTDKNSLSPENNTLNIDIESSYLFGAPASNLTMELNTTLKPSPISSRNFRNFVFSNETIDFKVDKRQWSKGTLDKEGKSSITYTLPDFEQAPSSLSLTLEAKVFEKGGRPNPAKKSVKVNTYSHYVGIARPDLDYGYAQAGSPLTFQAILLNSEGEVTAGRPLTFKVYKNNHYWWWEYRSSDERKLKFKSDIDTELVAEGSFTSGSVPENINFTPEESGEYFLEVSNGNGHTAGLFFSAYYWGDSTGRDNADVVQLKCSKPKYKPGDEAIVTFPSPEKGTIVVSLEKSGRILKTWQQASKGKDTQITFPITSDMIPNCYLSVMVIQPHGVTANNRPLRMYGIIPVMVEDPSTRIKVDLSVDEELKASEPFKIKIQCNKKEKTQMVLAVVDEGLLALTGFQTPDPWKGFNKKEKLNIHTFDMFSHVLNANKGDIFHSFSIGGDEYMERPGKEKEPSRRRFKPVSLFYGPFFTDNNGIAEVTLNMPDYIGAVRVMAVALKQGSFGHSDKTVPVKKDVMVSTSLPRVLHPKDRFRIPVTVFGMKENLGTVTVSIDTQGPVKALGNTVKQLTFNRQEEQDAYFELSIDNALGQATVTISARAEHSSSTYKTDLEIRAYSPELTEKEVFTVDKGTVSHIIIPDKGVQGSNRVSLTVMKRPELDITHRLNWLIRYPYGCIEQTTSSVFPQLFLDSASALTEKDKEDISRNINKAIQKLSRFTTPSGGFSYWPGGRDVSQWGTNYAGHFLIEAAKKGYHVPESMMSNWVKYQQSKSRTTNDHLLTRIYRVYLLALAGYSESGAMNLLKENSLKDMSHVEKWLLAGSYKLAGDPKTASNILQTAGTDVTSYRETGNTYGSNLRDSAIILEMSVLFDRKSEAASLLELISGILSQKGWLSTQETAYSLMAVNKYLSKYSGGKEEKISGTITLPDGTKHPFDTSENSMTFDISSGFGQQLEVKMDNSSTLSHLFAVVNWSGIPADPEIKETHNGIKLTAEFLDENGYTLNPSNLNQGTSFFIHYRVKGVMTSRTYLEELVLEAMLPSGWEIENTRLSGESNPQFTSDWKLGQEEYMDIRDDRINWFFDLRYYPGQLDFLVKINCITEGSYILPPALCEAMYDRNYHSVIPGQHVKVLKK